MSQQTTPPSASTADGSFFESSRKGRKGKRRGLFGLISKSSAEPAAAPTARPTTQTAQAANPSAQQLNKAIPVADRRLTQGRQGKATPLHMGPREGEQRRSHAEHEGSRPAEKVLNKPVVKELIDGIDADLHQRLVKELGQPARKKKPVNATLAEKMHKAGWSYKQIAKYFGVSPCTVRRRLREAKLLK